MPSDRPKQPKREALKRYGTLNPHPDGVTDPLFQTGDFFDPDDLVQVKYEMLRRVRVDKQSVSQSASAFGFSRPTYYQAEDDFQREGLAGLLPEISADPVKATNSHQTFWTSLLNFAQAIRPFGPRNWPQPFTSGSV